MRLSVSAIVFLALSYCKFETYGLGLAGGEVLLLFIEELLGSFHTSVIQNA